MMPSPIPAYAEHKHLSKYYKFENNSLTHIFNAQTAPLRTQHLHDVMRATIESPAFPCVGAKAALKMNSYRFAHYGDINSLQTINGLSHDLEQFALNHKGTKEGPKEDVKEDIKGQFKTFITCFDETQFRDEKDFEDQVWKLLGTLANIDGKHHDWDPIASNDPEDPYFAFSFAGVSYFVAAFAPQAPRFSRQFVVPALVFNAHHQFEVMKHQGKFDKMKEVIRKRDAALQGEHNDIASSFGELPNSSIQYCGVKPDEGKKWKCPFHKYYKPSS